MEISEDDARAIFAAEMNVDRARLSSVAQEALDIGSLDIICVLASAGDSPRLDAIGMIQAQPRTEATASP